VIVHKSFEDPAAASGPEPVRLAVFRRVRDELREYLRSFAALIRGHVVT
jgi:arsenate reductase